MFRVLFCVTNFLGQTYPNKVHSKVQLNDFSEKFMLRNKFFKTASLYSLL